MRVVAEEERLRRTTLCFSVAVDANGEPVEEAGEWGAGPQQADDTYAS
jgi:hypothetical protein